MRALWAVVAAMVPGVAMAAAVQPPAVLTAVTGIGATSPAAGENRVRQSPADVFAGLVPITTRRTASGVVVRVWLYAARRGACEAGREAQTCPRLALLVSTSPDREGAAQYGLWTSSPRLYWGPASSAPRTASGEDRLDYRLTACEASGEVDSGEAHHAIGDDWREATYSLKVGRYGDVSFTRLADEGPPRGCFRG